MEWASLYGSDRRPTEAAIAEFVASPLWAELDGFLRDTERLIQLRRKIKR